MIWILLTVFLKEPVTFFVYEKLNEYKTFKLHFVQKQHRLAIKLTNNPLPHLSLVFIVTFLFWLYTSFVIQSVKDKSGGYIISLPTTGWPWTPQVLSEKKGPKGEIRVSVANGIIMMLGKARSVAHRFKQLCNQSCSPTTSPHKPSGKSSWKGLTLSVMRCLSFLFTTTATRRRKSHIDTRLCHGAFTCALHSSLSSQQPYKLSVYTHTLEERKLSSR